MGGLQKINVKFFVADSAGLESETFIRIFNSWIQAGDGAYYDVADYSHVQSGPGIVLVAHEANISLDNAGNRLGLLYNRKEPLQGSNCEKLRLVFRSTLENCCRMEKEPLLEGRLRFLGNEALVFVNDRLLAPNNEETFRAIRPDLEAVARDLFGEFQCERESPEDPRKRFCVRIKAPGPLTVEAILNNITQ